jgi:hypothetical protein
MPPLSEMDAILAAARRLAELLYELLGWWRRSSELQRVHFAEQWNEYQHLLVMESLGGDRSWRDRFLAQHAALAYFGLLCFEGCNPVFFRQVERRGTKTIATAVINFRVAAARRIAASATRRSSRSPCSSLAARSPRTTAARRRTRA